VTLNSRPLVVGTGIAGLWTAWRLASEGREVLLVTKATLQDSNTAWAIESDIVQNLVKFQPPDVSKPEAAPPHHSHRMTGSDSSRIPKRSNTLS
jgi:2-polyprenyl-6-methoxyphenol hydroxylase-like FAD-dependent oxidoreductase